MDLNALKHLLSSTNLSSNKSVVSELLKVAQLKPGTELLATVENLYKVSPKQLDSFLKNGHSQVSERVTEPKSLLNKSIASDAKPAQKEKPVFFLAELTVRQKKLYVLTDSPQKLPLTPKLKIGPKGEVIVIGGKDQSKPNTSPSNSNSNQIKLNQVTNTAQNTFTSSNRVTPPDNSKVAIERAANLNTQPAKHNPISNLTSALDTLRQGLKSYQPKQSPLVNVLRNLDQLATSLNQALHLANTKLPKEQLELVQTLNKLTSKAPNLEVIKNASSFERILKESGFQLEGNLKYVSQTTKQFNDAGIQRPAASLSPLVTHSLTKDGLFSNARTETHVPRDQASIEHDTKVLLLKLSDQLNLLSQQFNLSKKTDSISDESFTRLILNVLNQTPSFYSKTHSDSTRNAALAKLFDLVSSGIARISQLQINHLMNMVQDPQLTGSGGNFEVPIRIGDSLIPVFISIQEHIEQREDAQSDEAPGQEFQKSWNVYMELEIDNFGYFASEINYVNDQVKTKFWIEDKGLESQAKVELDAFKQELRDKGVEIEEVIFSNGQPPSRTTGLHQSLVDVET